MIELCYCFNRVCIILSKLTFNDIILVERPVFHRTRGSQDLSGALKVSQRTLRVSQGVSGAFLRLSRAVREPSEALRGFQGTLRGLSVSHEPSGSLRFFQGLSEDSQGLSGTLKDSQGLPGFLRP